MATKTFKAKIKLKTGFLQDVTVQADNFMNAKAMLESQYGVGSVIWGPVESR
jgi:hypothetical protein